MKTFCLVLLLCCSTTASAQTPSDAPATPSAHTDRLTVLLRSLYVSTAVLQGLDVHSTLYAMRTGNNENNAVMRGLVARPALFIGVKASVGGGLILASHKMAKRDKVASIVMLAAVNSAYAAVVVHNYRINR